MRWPTWICLVFGALFAVLLPGCGSRGFTDFDGGLDGGNPYDGTGPTFDTGPPANDGGPCVGLQCQQTCASTSISGTVYDPAGVNGLYNVFVYVPNSALAAITDGPVCTQCQAPASGNPIASATTDAMGHFTLTNAPVGTNIPLVLQVGKWRRRLTIASVASCVDNPQPDKSLRLPRKQHESSPDDNIPLMAMTTGCDDAECFFLRRIGIDQSEFTSPSGTGRIRVYAGTIDPNLYTVQTFPNGVGSATTLWNTASEMMKYDIVFDACECVPHDRGTSGYTNMLNYLDAGGRVFTTHYFYNFFATVGQCGADLDMSGNSSTCQGPAPLPSVASWGANAAALDACGNKPNPFTVKPTACSSCPNLQGILQGGPAYCFQIDTAVPKGKALADWYQGHNSSLKVGGGEVYGYLGLTDVRENVGKLSASLMSAGTVTPWLYAGDVNGAYDAYYLSFNAPVGTDPSTQCGRAIFSDVHLSGSLASATSSTFPGYCPTDPNSSSHAVNELALEFLFFDLSSCVQNDTLPPPPPPQ